MKISRGLRVASLGFILGAMFLGEVATAKVTISQSTIQQQQLTQSPPFITDYVFTDGEWVIKIKRKGRDLIYDGLNNNEGKGIRITGVRKSGTKERHIYTWRNRGAYYIVIWQPSDPTFIRVQVKDGSQTVLDKLLEAQN
jgi:hypothetical protein